MVDDWCYDGKMVDDGWRLSLVLFHTPIEGFRLVGTIA
jgi:hypothetical protein